MGQRVHPALLAALLGMGIGVVVGAVSALRFAPERTRVVHATLPPMVECQVDTHPRPGSLTLIELDSALRRGGPREVDVDGDWIRFRSHSRAGFGALSVDGGPEVVVLWFDGQCPDLVSLPRSLEAWVHGTVEGDTTGVTVNACGREVSVSDAGTFEVEVDLSGACEVFLVRTQADRQVRSSGVVVNGEPGVVVEVTLLAPQLPSDP